MGQKSINDVFLLLLESGAHYKAYLGKKDNLKKHELLICCLSVSAIDYCQKNRIQFILPEDCYNDNESNHYRDLSEQKIRGLVKRLNKHYRHKISSIDSFFFEAGNYHFFMIYHFFGALHHRAFFLDRVIKKHKVKHIMIPQEPKATKKNRPFPVSQYHNCYLDLCLNSIYKERVIPIPVKSSVVRQYNTPRTVIRSAVGKFLRKFRIFNDYLNYIQNNITVNLRSLIFRHSSTDILLLGSAGPWKYIFPDPRLKNKVSVFFEADEVELTNKDIKNWFLEWFNWDDVFCGFNLSALGHYEMTRIKLLSEKFISSHEETLIRLKQHKVLIYAVAPYASQQYFLSVAKHLGLPRVCFQHGEMSLYYSGLWDEASEMLYVSHYFSYGDQVSIEKTRNASGVKGFKRAISIGSPALDKLRNTILPKQNYILYASSKFMNYSAGFVSRYCDRNVMENQSLLINYFEEYLDLNPSSQVIWKHNQERLTEQATKITNKVIVIREEKTFLDLIPEAKIIILDRPSTTALEVCITDKPLFVLLANKNWFSLPEELLRKRAMIAYTPLELHDAIDEYLKKGIYPADVNNREFINAYGCHLDDEKSKSRALSELFNIIQIA